MFSIVDKLKQLAHVVKDVVEDFVETLTDRGYEAETVSDDTLKVETKGDPVDEVMNQATDWGFEGEGEYVEDVDTPEGESYVRYFYEYHTKNDEKVCPDCTGYSEAYDGKLELRVDANGTIHEGADEQIIQFLLKNATKWNVDGYSIIQRRPDQSFHKLQLHVDKDPKSGKNSCRCELIYIPIGTE